MAKIIQFPKKEGADKLVLLENYRRQTSIFQITEHKAKLLKLNDELARIKRQLLKLVKDADGKD